MNVLNGRRNGEPEAYVVGYHRCSAATKVTTDAFCQINNVWTQAASQIYFTDPTSRKNTYQKGFLKCTVKIYGHG